MVNGRVDCVGKVSWVVPLSERRWADRVIFVFSRNLLELILIRL